MTTSPTNTPETTLDDVLESAINLFEASSVGEITDEGFQLGMQGIRAALSAMVFDQIIGEDIDWSWEERMQYSTRETDALDYMFAVNGTKAEQRQRAAKMGFTVNQEEE